MNHVSFLEADILVSKKKLTSIYLILCFLFLFFFIIHFRFSLFYYFLSSTFSGTQVRTVRKGSYAPDFVKNNFSLSKAQHD